ncbi:MAG: cytochrome c family protein [Rickettsiales bacterium]|jgi:cytochrome c|nr:cytochrome c family protein [Rickettsiales bacterium]
MDRQSFEMNKIAGAVLLAGVVAMFAGIGSEILYHGGGSHSAHSEKKRGYTIEGAETADAGAGTEAAKEWVPEDIAPFMAKADVAAGEAQIKKCTACHTFDNSGKNGVGPNQWAIYNSDFAHKSDFAYSDALKTLHGKKKWSEQELSAFIENPRKYIPGNKMSFAGIKNPQDRANLIAYLKTLR